MTPGCPHPGPVSHHQDNAPQAQTCLQRGPSDLPFAHPPQVTGRCLSAPTPSVVPPKTPSLQESGSWL